MSGHKLLEFAKDRHGKLVYTDTPVKFFTGNYHDIQLPLRIEEIGNVPCLVFVNRMPGRLSNELIITATECERLSVWN
jgi:hypothetical protein